MIVGNDEFIAIRVSKGLENARHGLGFVSRMLRNSRSRAAVQPNSYSQSGEFKSVVNIVQC